jgi:hypothetical protein
VESLTLNSLKRRNEGLKESVGHRAYILNGNLELSGTKLITATITNDAQFSGCFLCIFLCEITVQTFFFPRNSLLAR